VKRNVNLGLYALVGMLTLGSALGLPSSPSVAANSLSVRQSHNANGAPADSKLLTRSDLTKGWSALTKKEMSNPGGFPKCMTFVLDPIRGATSSEVGYSSDAARPLLEYLEHSTNVGRSFRQLQADYLACSNAGQGAGQVAVQPLQILPFGDRSVGYSITLGTAKTVAVHLDVVMFQKGDYVGEVLIGGGPPHPMPQVLLLDRFTLEAVIKL
jgi:hypothetical protein